MSQEWTPPSREELLSGVLSIVDTDRWDQNVWLGNEFDVFAVWDLTVDEIRPYAGQPLPVEPSDEERPVCGTTGCVAWWIAVLAAPPGTKIDPSGLFLPDGSESGISTYARTAVGLSVEQAAWLFDGDRSRDEVVEALTLLTANPDANLYDIYDD